MKSSSFVAATLVLATVFAVTACSSSSAPETPIGKDVITPLSVEANDLQGEQVELTVGQVLNINTGSLAVDSYTGTVADTDIAVFTEGNAQGSAETNPGVEAVAVGTTTVTMINKQGGIQPLTFTVKVSKAP